MVQIASGSEGAGVTAGDSDDHHPKAGLLALSLGSIGVVYGDIGTSPLYAFREALKAAGEENVFNREDVFGVLSLILWALILVVTVKYVLILIRADNDGEGGILSLLALAQRSFGQRARVILLLGLTGAALFYGDAMITPALSVLSAVEGLEVAAPNLGHAVMPLTVLILLALFSVQAYGTARISALFGPITLVWFMVLGAMGLWQILAQPEVLGALDPTHAVHFLSTHGFVGLLTLGAVFLAVTGAEALYADLGHFGRKPIQLAWLVVVLPCLTLNYFGQGALVLGNPEAIANPFFLLAPGWAQLPLVGLATAATVIASQAVITGCYSLSRQAIHLRLLPRLETRHTSEALAGQIYLPRINFLLLVGVLLLVVTFGSSGALASAYGISVTGTMVVTAILAAVVIWREWRWSLMAAIGLIAPFLLIDVAFLAANMLKLLEGGWLPIAIAAAVLSVMLTWRRGTRILFEKTRRLEVPLATLLPHLEASPPHRVPGTAVFLTSDPESTPTALLHSLKHYRVLHERNAILTVLTFDKPWVSDAERVSVEPVTETFTRITIRFGFAETPNVPKALAIVRKKGWTFDIMSTSFFLSRRSVRQSARSEMPAWQDRLFILLARNADDASNYFQIPTGRVVEIGTQITL